MIVEERFIAEEHPEGDKFQLMMLGVFLAIWITDSFVIHAVSLSRIDLISFGVVVAATGVYLVSDSHRLVIDTDIPTFIDWGVYSIARHPMYLGIMLVYLGLTISTGSVASLLILVGVFYIYDRIADYEETGLSGKLGARYHEYCGNVLRWGFI